MHYFLFWHGNTVAIARCHVIITCKLHAANLIGAIEFRNATSVSPRKRSMCTRPFPPFGPGVGSGNEITCRHENAQYNNIILCLRP